MTDTIAGPGISRLQDEIAKLTVRRDEISDAIDNHPVAPPPDTIEAIRAYLGHIIAEGTSAERKAAIEQLIAEIRITDDRKVIPVFKIPRPDVALEGDATATGSSEAARFARCFDGCAARDSNPEPAD
jgi:site-specific DNA recombinase